MPEMTELMKRPTKSDEIVKRRALDMLMPKVKAYLGQDWRESEKGYIEEQMMDVLDEFHDGYQMARELENRHHWEPDRGLLHLMDEAEHFLYLAYKEILGQWIRCYGIAPARKVGDVVSTTNWHRKGKVGKITRIYEDEAKYAVHFPDQPITFAQILEYEEIIDALVTA